MDTSIGWCPANLPRQSSHKRDNDSIDEASLLTPAPTPTKDHKFCGEQQATMECVMSTGTNDDDLESRQEPSSQGAMPQWVRALFIDCGTHLAVDISKANKLREEIARKKRGRGREINDANKSKSQEWRTQQRGKTLMKSVGQDVQAVEKDPKHSENPDVKIARDGSEEISVSSGVGDLRLENTSALRRAQITQIYLEKYNFHRYGQLAGDDESQECEGYRTEHRMGM